MAVRNAGRANLMRRRIAIAFWLILLCYLLLVGRLLYLQVREGPLLRAEAIRLREQKIALRAHRGLICDVKGNPLAVSLYAGTVGFDPSAAQPDPTDPKKTAKMEQALASSIARAAVLLHLPESALTETIHNAQARENAKKPVRFVPILKGVSLEMAQSIREARPRLLGFGVEDGSRRYYAGASDAAQIVGFLGPDGHGAAGLERSCDLRLNGKAGYAVAEVDDHRREIPGTIRRLLPAIDGLDVHTTIDADAQHIAEQEAQRIYDRYHPNGISVVVVTPATGDVQALVSLPTFDPNPGRRNTITIESLADRCAARLYEPGSTLKSLTIAAALDNGTIHLDSGFNCTGSILVGKRRIHCSLHGPSERYGHGYQTPADILRHSCNVGAAQIGLRMGAKALYAADRKFGLFDSLGLGLPAEQKGILQFSKRENIDNPGKVARVAFGHAITTTPLHVAMAYAAIANGGVLMKPRLLTSLTDGRGNTVAAWKPRIARRVISARTSAEVCAMLRGVIANGTGKVAAITGYQVAGKTGTANKYRRGAYVGSFVGFVPASGKEKPDAVILVAVDEPHGAYYGAEVAAPAFQAIARRLLSRRHIPEDDPESVQARTAAENLRREGHAPLLAAAPAAQD